MTGVRVKTDPDMPSGCILIGPEPGVLPSDMPDSEAVKYFCLVINVGKKADTFQHFTTASEDDHAAD